MSFKGDTTTSSGETTAQQDSQDSHREPLLVSGVPDAKLRKKLAFLGNQQKAMRRFLVARNTRRMRLTWASSSCSARCPKPRPREAGAATTRQGRRPLCRARAKWGNSFSTPQTKMCIALSFLCEKVYIYIYMYLCMRMYMCTQKQVNKQTTT